MEQYKFFIMGEEEHISYDLDTDSFKTNKEQNQNLNNLIEDIKKRKHNFIEKNIKQIQGIYTTSLNFVNCPSDMQIIGFENELYSLIGHKICYVHILKQLENKKEWAIYSSSESPTVTFLGIKNNSITNVYNVLSKLLSLSDKNYVYTIPYKFHNNIADEVEWKAIENIIRELIKKYGNKIIITDYPEELQ